MNKFQKISIFLLRISLGWLMLYSGITAILNHAWSAGAYLQAAKSFPAFFHLLSSPSILPVVNIMAEWGLALLGVSLILGIFVRWSSVCGAVLMLMFYLPILSFPYPNAHSFLVDEHIIYITALLMLSSFRAGRICGIDSLLKS